MLGPANAVDARITINEKSFRLMGIHLSTPLTAQAAAARDAQLGELAARIRSVEEPLVVVGDFNISPFSPHFARFVEQTELTDAFAGRGPEITWPTFLPIMGIPIDHALVSRDWRIVDYRRLPAFGSDHYPMVIEIQ